MKKNLKSYLEITICTIVCALFPWLLSCVGIVTKLSAMDRYAIPFAIAAVVLLVYCVIRYTNGIATRLTTILLSPVVYYLIFLLVIRYLFAKQPWDGFHLA